MTFSGSCALGMLGDFSFARLGIQLPHNLVFVQGRYSLQENAEQEER